MSDTHANEHVEEEDESLSSFRMRLEAETERLTGLCNRWEFCLEDDLDIPNDLQVIHILCPWRGKPQAYRSSWKWIQAKTKILSCIFKNFHVGRH